MFATCKFTGVCERVIVSDISRKGCKIEAAEMPLAINQDLILKINGLEEMFGTVRWVKGKCAGIELDYPLHPSVVDHLSRSFPYTVDRHIGPKAW